MKVPPLLNVPNNYFDFVISFQVIEHIKNDQEFVNEIHRVLKPNGKLIVTTPNKKTSLTRNPWHVREYTINELDNLLKSQFCSVEKMGVFGGEKTLPYYEKNKQFVRQITRFDIFNLQYNLPRFVLQLPYDLLNRLNRNRLLKNGATHTTEITTRDYFLNDASDTCLDLFYIALKKNRDFL